MLLNISKKISIFLVGFLAILSVLVVAIWYLFFTIPPYSDLKIDESRIGEHGAAIIRVDTNTAVSDIANDLKQKGIINSSGVFLSVVQKLNRGRSIKQGVYAFERPITVFEAVDRFSKGDYGYTPVRLTIPEGYSTLNIAEILPSKLVDIKEEDFLKDSQGLEGFLFPDTYFFYPFATSSAVIELMQNNFENKIRGLETQLNINFRNDNEGFITIERARASSTDLNALQINLHDVITLASILEKEVRTKEDMAMVADLFLRRMDQGMPLQADSTLTYITGKDSLHLTMDDLISNNAYNSYKSLGLPPTPISNPGLNAINATLNPQKNEYLFFLSDDEGITHFSKTYSEHLRLKKKYLP